MAEAVSDAVAFNLQEDSEEAPVMRASNLVEAPVEASTIDIDLNTNSNSRSCLPMKRKLGDAETTIIWPPVVIIENTITQFDPEKRLWKGLENEEIRNFVKGVLDMEQFRVQAVYNRFGNRGKSVVVLPSTPSGFLDAQTLCDLLEREKRGRRHWLQVAHLKDLCGPGRIDTEGKKILFGYLANTADMMDIDFQRKTVKRWCEESLVDKVLQPLKRIEQEKEEAKKKRAELAEQAKQIELSVEHSRFEFSKAAAEFQKINQAIQSQKKQEEELEAKHKKTFEERTTEYEKEKLQKLEAFKEREKHIRDKLQQNNIVKQNAASQYEELARRLKAGINMEKKKHELWSAEQRQVEILEHMQMDASLQSQMEEKLALLEKKFQEKQLELQREQNKQIMKLRADCTEEKEKFLEGKLKELERIEKESQEAKTATTETQKQFERECILCLDDIVEEKRERALLACGHANICSKCAPNYWKSESQKRVNPLCPTCNTEQLKKYKLIPAVIYS